MSDRQATPADWLPVLVDAARKAVAEMRNAVEMMDAPETGLSLQSEALDDAARALEAALRAVELPGGAQTEVQRLLREQETLTRDYQALQAKHYQATGRFG